MAQVILLRNTFLEQVKIETFLRNDLCLDLIVKDSIKEVLMMLRILPDVQAVILPETDSLKSNSYDALNEFCGEQNLSSSIVISKKSSNLSSELNYLPLSNKKIRFVSYDLALDEMMRVLKLAIAGESVSDDRVYFSVPFSLILNTLLKNLTNQFPFDLYIGIKREEEKLQYILRFRKNEIIELTDIEKYKNQKNAKYLFVNVQEKKFFDDFFSSLKGRGTVKEEKSFEGKVYDAEVTSQVLRNHFASFGLDEKGKELLDEYFNNSMLALKDLGAFSMLLKLFFDKTASYQYVHSMILALVLNKVTHKLGWDSPSFKEKVAFICLVHDLCLVDDELTHIESEIELNNSDLTDAQKIMAMNHALKISTMIADYKDRAIGVEEVLREHHGMKNGIGYARELNFHLHHLSIAFIVTQHFVHEFLKLENPKKETIKEIVSSMEIIYSKGFYLKAYQALHEVFK